MTPIEEQYIEKLKEYQKLLGDELDEVVVMMSIHGWKSHRYEQGKKLREEIASLEQQIKQEIIADSDIEAWAIEYIQRIYIDESFALNTKLWFLITGAKAVLNGEIKHIK